MLNVLSNYMPRQAPLILEVGAGLGDFAYEFIHRYANYIHYILLDIDRDAMMESMKSLKVFPCDWDFILADAQRLPFRSEIFDVVICAEVLEHVSDDFSAMSEIKRVLRKKAIGIVSIPLHSRKDKGEVRTYNINTFKNLVNDAGLSIDSILLCCRIINLINKIFKYLFKREGMGEKEAVLYSKIPIIPKIFTPPLMFFDSLLSKRQPQIQDEGTLIVCIRRYT